MIPENRIGDIPKELLNEKEFQHCIVRCLYSKRLFISCPNISWGFGFHEMDLICVSQTRVATEIEIKISIADLIRDGRKKHGHDCMKIKNFYYALPQKLIEKSLPYIKSDDGIIGVNYDPVAKKLCSYFYRKCKPRKVFEYLTESETLNVARLGLMRYWK